MRVAVVSSFVVLLAVACGGVEPPTTPNPQRSAGDVCPPSSVPSRAACPSHTVPPGDGSAVDDCKSDADCKAPGGFDGRCIKNPLRGELAPRAAGNLLAGPPRPPPHALCVYDGCHTDADCGDASRCACGSGRGEDRNQCLPLDRCRADRDCPADNVCTCGAANYCVEGDCHHDADCSAGMKCEDSRCHTKNDKCKSHADCPPTSEGGRRCAFGRESRHWECQLVPPIPPG